MVFKLVISTVITFLITVIVYPLFIRYMRRTEYGQQIREDGPESHVRKAGTPTMGGVVFILVSAVVAVIAAGFSPQLLIILLVTVGCGLIGFVDDYYKIIHRHSLGLKARSKLAGGIIITVFFIILLKQYGYYSTELLLPFLNRTLDLSYFYPVFVFLIITAATNSVNLTDGIDGLAVGVSIVVLASYMVIAIWSNLSVGITIFCGSLLGGCFGFLLFNRHPARLFMGDAGSFALGGLLAALAILTKTELFLIIIGAVFVIETVSVMVQVISFQLTGKRILLMSPLHHHFELTGWSEWRIAVIFWAAALFFALLGLYEYSRVSETALSGIIYEPLLYSLREVLS